MNTINKEQAKELIFEAMAEIFHGKKFDKNEVKAFAKTLLEDAFGTRQVIPCEHLNNLYVTRMQKVFGVNV